MKWYKGAPFTAKLLYFKRVAWFLAPRLRERHEGNFGRECANLFIAYKISLFWRRSGATKLRHQLNARVDDHSRTPRHEWRGGSTKKNGNEFGV
jgi:hypothetical protein